MWKWPKYRTQTAEEALFNEASLVKLEQYMQYPSKCMSNMYKTGVKSATLMINWRLDQQEKGATGRINNFVVIPLCTLYYIWENNKEKKQSF